MRICIWYIKECEYNACKKAFEYIVDSKNGVWFQNVSFNENRTVIDSHCRIRDLTNACRKHQNWIILQELKPGDDPHARHTVYGFDIPVNSVVAGGVDPMAMADKRFLVSSQVDNWRSTYIPSR